MAEESKRKKLEALRGQLDLERSSFIAHWRDLNDYINPRRGRFLVSDVNKGDRRNQKIIDSTATLASRTLRAGMMGGITSPARPWFRLTTPDPDLAEFGKVKEWLHFIGQRMATAFLRSNLYNTLPMLYGDLGDFATSPLYIEEDIDSIIRTQSFPIGSYMIAKDYKGSVNVFVRDFRMTVRQLVDVFGRKDGNGKPDWSNLSDFVKECYERGDYETWVDVCHVIQPNENYDSGKILAKFKKFSSCYFERSLSGRGRSEKDDMKFLRESGYDYFPVLCPRWEVTGEDVYGTNCPGMAALGDIKQLQLAERRIAQAIDKMVNPPMTAPTSMRNTKASILPGDISFVDIREGQNGFRPAHEVNARIVEIENKQEQVRQRIRRAYFEDLFLMMANSDRRDITAREIDERHEEKLLALGPVLEQLNQDLLDPLIDNTFDIMVKQGLIPEAPEELHGLPLKVEYISIMAQAQKLLGIATIERFAGFVGQVAQANPESLDKIDSDQMIDVYAEMTSIPPGIVRADDKVAEIRGQRARAQQAQAQAQMIEQGSAAAKNLSQTDLESDNALKRMLDQAGAGQVVGGV